MNPDSSAHAYVQDCLRTPLLSDAFVVEQFIMLITLRLFPQRIITLWLIWIRTNENSVRIVIFLPTYRFNICAEHLHLNIYAAYLKRIRCLNISIYVQCILCVYITSYMPQFLTILCQLCKHMSLCYMSMHIKY